MTSPTDALDSPVNFLSAMLGANLPDEPVLRAYEAQCRRVPVSALAEGTPDADDIRRGYVAGVVWRGYVQETALPVFLLMYIAAFHDPRLVDVYTPTLIVTQMVDKYAPEPIRSEWLTRLKARDGSTPQGAVWVNALTPSSRSPLRSDFGRPEDADPLSPSPSGRGEKEIPQAKLNGAETFGRWHLNGSVNAPRNIDAELAVVSVQVEDSDAPTMFLVPRLRMDGSANFQTNADEAVFDGSEAWLLGELSDGPSVIEEIDGLTLAANCIGAVALAQRMLREIDKPRRAGRLPELRAVFAGAWNAVMLLNWTWREMPGFISGTGRLFQLVVRVARLDASWVNIRLVQLRWRADTKTLPELTEGQRIYHTTKTAYIHGAIRDATVLKSFIALCGSKVNERISQAIDELLRLQLADTKQISPDAAQELVSDLARLISHLADEALARQLEAARAIAGDSISF